MPAWLGRSKTWLWAQCTAENIPKANVIAAFYRSIVKLPTGRNPVVSEPICVLIVSSLGAVLPASSGAALAAGRLCGR